MWVKQLHVTFVLFNMGNCKVSHSMTDSAYLTRSVESVVMEGNVKRTVAEKH